MSMAVKLSEPTVKALRTEANVMHRSIAAQAEHWIRLGQAIEQSPAMSAERVRAAFKGLLHPEALTDAEFDQFLDAVAVPGPSSERAFAELRARGDYVGYDDEGRLVHVHADGRYEVIEEPAMTSRG